MSFSTLQIGSLIEATPPRSSTKTPTWFQYPSNRVVDRSTSLVLALKVWRFRFSTLQIGSLIEAAAIQPAVLISTPFQYPSNRVVDRSDFLPVLDAGGVCVSVPFKSGR